MNISYKIKNIINYLFYSYIYNPNKIILNYNETHNNKRIVVSLTTINSRINSVDLVIKSLLNQTLKPNKIILYLGDDINIEIPKKLQNLKNCGIEIVTKCKDLKPHKKYFYVMQKYPNDIVVTVDDDVIYDKRLIERMFKMHIKDEKSVICTRARIITRDINNDLLPYSKWPLEKNSDEKPKLSYLPTGVGGVLYPPHSINKEAFNEESLITNCLMADDIWLKAMEIKQNTKVICLKTKNIDPYQIPKTNKSALYKDNLNNNRNDMYIKKMEEYYKIEIDGNKKNR